MCVGQTAGPPNVEPSVYMNTSFTPSSPTMYFMTETITVHFEGGKFVYELEGTDLLQKAQQQYLNKVFGVPDARTLKKCILQRL